MATMPVQPALLLDAPTITFTCYATPQPQGSVKGFVLPGRGGRGARAIITSDNAKLKPYRQQLTLVAMEALKRSGQAVPFAGKHVPVRLLMVFYVEKPASATKKRTRPVVKPDISKLIRSTEDAMTGILYADDAQIVQEKAEKRYGTPERVEITVVILNS